MSAAFTIPWWGVSPIAVGFGGGTVNTAGDLGSVGLTILCADTLLRGLVALWFIERLRQRVRRPIFRRRDRDQIQRTLWLSGLPAYDGETGARFLFENSDFERVAEDLRRALTDELNVHTLGLKKQFEMQVEVAPVVDEWHRVSSSLRHAQALIALVVGQMCISSFEWHSFGVR